MLLKRFVKAFCTLNSSPHYIIPQKLIGVKEKMIFQKPKCKKCTIKFKKNFNKFSKMFFYFS